MQEAICSSRRLERDFQVVLFRGGGDLEGETALGVDCLSLVHTEPRLTWRRGVTLVCAQECATGWFGKKVGESCVIMGL
jgi:hypothetical protein